MGDIAEFRLPDGVDWREWVDRWDAMQQRYIAWRTERFDAMARIVRDTQRSVRAVLNLGCGPGSLMLPMLQAFAKATIFGIDFDPTMLLLARPRLEKFGRRAVLILADLREEGCFELVSGPVDAVVSATALHWLGPDSLADLYIRVAKVLRRGGVFLNADHVGSDFEPIQAAWEAGREKMRRAEARGGAEDWRSFWAAYGKALGVDIDELHGQLVGDWEGVEEGLPLAWHLDELRAAGFVSVDCFWRCDCDAIYGGIRR